MGTEPEVRIRTALLSNGLIARVGTGPFCIWLLLVRYICRTDQWQRIFRDLREAGFLVASLRQERLAELVGRSRDSANLWLTSLEKERLILRIHTKYRRSLIYVVGAMRDGKEILFAEEDGLWETQQKRAAQYALSPVESE